MRVLHIIHHLTTGGAARAMMCSAKVAQRIGGDEHRVVSLFPPEQDAAEMARQYGMTVSPARDVAAMHEEIENADIVHIHWWNTPYIQQLLQSELPPMRLLMTFHVAGDHAPQVITPNLVDFADIAVACCPHSFRLYPFRRLLEDGRADRCAMVIDPADLDRVQGLEPRPHDGFRVGYIGTVDFIKMHPRFVEMSAAVDIPGVRFVVCGGGPLDQLRARAAALSAADRFDFTGSVADIRPYLETMDVYGYPLTPETYAAGELNVQEAMAAGIPPVVFPYGGLVDLVEHEKTGLVVHSEREYVEAIEYLYHHPAERLHLGAAAREHALAHYGSEPAGRTLADLYARLAGQSKRTRVWGALAGAPLLDQPLDIEQVSPLPAFAAGAQALISSLGPWATQFRRSSQPIAPSVADAADEAIAGASPLMAHEGCGGPIHYRQAYPEDPYLRYWTGLIRASQGCTGEAAAELAAAIAYGLPEERVARRLEAIARQKNADTDLDALIRRAEAAFEQHDLRDAMDALVAAVSADPRNPTVLNDLGVAWVALGETERAERLFLRALEIDADHADARENLADLLEAAGRRVEVALLRERSARPGTDAVRQSEAPQVRVSAIVSTYASQRFIRGCMEDLVGQTLFQQGAMEIIVIDACSPQDEQSIVAEFVARHANIRYVRTAEREPLYASWNRAARMARGRYMANANTDDRRRPDAFERLADALDASGAGLAYADLAFSRAPNAAFGQAEVLVRSFPDFDPRLAVHYNLACYTIMWTREAYETVGGFDESLKIAADFKFATTIGLRFGAVHVPEPLTMVLLHEEQISMSGDQTAQETDAIRGDFTRLPLDTIFRGADLRTPEARSRAYCELGNAALLLREPWYGNDHPAPSLVSAAIWYSRALAEGWTNPAALCNTALLRALCDRHDEAEQLLEQAIGADPEGAVVDAERCRAYLAQVRRKLTRSLLLDIPVAPSGFDYAPPKYRSTPGASAACGVPEPLSILLVMYGWADEGGGTIQPRQIARELARRGHRVSVLYAGAQPLPGYPAYHLLVGEEDGVRLFGIFNRGATFLDLEAPDRETDDPQVRPIVARVIQECRPDVIHFFNVLGLSMGAIEEAAAADVPILYTSFNYWPLCPRLYLFQEDLTLCNGPSEDGSSCARCMGRSDLAEAYARRTARGRAVFSRLIDRHLAVSTRVRELFLLNGHDGSRIHVLHQQPDRVDALWRQVGCARIDGEPRNGPLRVGFIGSLMPHKGPHLLVDAAQAFRPEEIEVHLFGGGPDRYVDLLRTMDVQGNVRFHGPYRPEELPEVLAQVDVVCVPSVWEDCAPHVVMEALAAGCPVIGSNIGGIPDMVQHGVTGLLVNPRDAGALIEAIRRFVTEPELLARMRSAIGAPAGFDAFVTTQLFHYREVVAARKRERAKHAPTSAPAGPEPLNRDASADVATGFSCRRAVGKLPDPLPSPLMLNLGCGEDVRPEMVNIDLYSDHPLVVGMDVRRLDLPDACADLVLASDILEHFSHREVDAVLAEWARVLKPGGEIVVRCPSLRLQVQAYLRGDWDADVASYMIFGGQTNPGDYHTVAFDQTSIRAHLARAGFEVTEIEEQDIPQSGGYINLNMVVRARKKTPRNEAALASGRPGAAGVSAL